MSRLLFLLMLVALLPTPIRAADDPEVEKLFTQLSSDDFKTREEARKQLIDRGEEAIPQIKALAEKAQDPETRNSVASILSSIESRSITGPSLITLDLTDAPAKDVIDAISKQARTELRAWPDDLWNQLDKKTLSLKVTREPFWAVMKDVLPQLGLQLNSHGPGNRLQIMRGTANMSGPSHVSGPFMVVAVSASESRIIQYGKDNQGQTGGTNINLNVYVEPRLRMLMRDYQPQIEDFVDDAGHSLIANRGRFGGHSTTTSRELTFNANINVPPVEGRTKKIAKLKGHFRATLQTKSETIEVSDILNAKNASQQKSEWTLTVKDVAVQGQGDRANYVLTLTFANNTGNRPNDVESWRRNLGFESLKLIDADGKELSKRGHSMSSDGKKWEGTFQFGRSDMPRAGEPVKLVWEFPTEAEEVQIPFDFKDLTLP